MDDFLAYVQDLLRQDGEIQQAFIDAGRDTGVFVRAPGGETEEVYPSIVVWVAPGDSVTTCEGPPLAERATMTIVTLDRDGGNDTPHYGLETAWIISKRIQEILAGVEDDGEVIGGIVNIDLPAASGDPVWMVVACTSTTPNGPMADEDPLITKLKLTFRTMVARI